MSRPSVVLLRGHNANVWDLRPLEALQDEFDLRVLVTGSNLHDLAGLGLPQVAAGTPRDRLPVPQRAAGAAAYALGERYRDLEQHLTGADVVHSAEIHSWFSAQAAGLKDRLGFKLVLTVWETLPFLGTYRWPRERRYRTATIPQVDRVLAATRRTADTLTLEGVDPARVEVSAPGIALERFAAPADHAPGAPGTPHTVLSAGRLVWEKGHQDVLRAVAALRRGIVGPGRADVRALILGDGPERSKLEAYAAELGLTAAGAVEFRQTVPYDQIPAVYHAASALVLGSLVTKAWEEQFGMVLVEAMAAGLPVIACDTGAIPEVTSGHAALVAPGDWRGMAAALLEGPLASAPATRAAPPTELLERVSARAAARRTAAAYRTVLGS
ncbi:D-inositol-3-phosphate glycosyltransferase [Baekduia alba]|uniref:glycosyltransferase family 4 protein n=1 Tax=Baekduia alba TaxID=2997333 RepID=UPI00233FAD55|nr:glycosyltransferase family 4 protein [Baekduia alba]WCB96586.1 D-inositol-3-phosphate glycosyltransferase [Baekduia alba]